MEVEKNGRKLKEEDHNRHLSGAYIRRLVKQLSSSKTKDSKSYYSNCTHPNNKQQQLTTTSSKLEEGGDDDDHERQQQPKQQQQQHKKQVRRRLHTSRPYQERLLNMAEARREIVTALKFHRAAQHKQQHDDHPQKQKHEKQPQQPPPPPPPPPQRFSSHSEQSHLSNYSTTTFPNLYSPCPWSIPTNINPTIINDQNLVISSPTLPDQTLGLNLNFHDFNNTLNYYMSSNSNSNSNLSSSSSSSSFSVATHHHQDISSQQPVGNPIISDEQGGGGGGGNGNGNGDGDGNGDGGLEVLHATLDDEEMENIRSIGEQHQMEWNDTLNLVTSAWWFKFFKKADEEDHDHPFHDHDHDEAMEFPFPDWLSTANDSCVLQQQHFDDHYSHDYFQDPALPCMEIGEIEEMDEEWLA